MPKLLVCQALVFNVAFVVGWAQDRIMRREFVAQNLGGELKGEPDSFACRQPSDGGTFFSVA